MDFPPLVAQLVAALRALPGVGPKSAQRMAFHLLRERYREDGRRLGLALKESMDGIGHCIECRAFSETERCPVCTSPRRDRSLLCVVETPADMVAIDQTGYIGLYFVLLGHLSPLDGIGPEEIGMELFKQRLAHSEIKEVIIATNSTVEGEATSHYLAHLCKQKSIASSRIAHGVPMGGELEFIDGGTLSHALLARERL